MAVAVAITKMIDDQMPGIGSKKGATGVYSLDRSRRRAAPTSCFASPQPTAQA